MHLINFIIIIFYAFIYIYINIVISVAPQNIPFIDPHVHLAHDKGDGQAGVISLTTRRKTNNNKKCQNQTTIVAPRTGTIVIICGFEKLVNDHAPFADGKVIRRYR